MLGPWEGAVLGVTDGAAEGTRLGSWDNMLGVTDGAEEGTRLGFWDSMLLGATEGLVKGKLLGWGLGKKEGC